MCTRSLAIMIDVLPRMVPQRSPSPTDNKFQIQALLRRYVSCSSSSDESVSEDVTLTINALLDSVDAMQSKSEITLIPDARSRKLQKGKAHCRQRSKALLRLSPSTTDDQPRPPSVSLPSFADSPPRYSDGLSSTRLLRISSLPELHLSKRKSEGHRSKFSTSKWKSLGLL